MAKKGLGKILRELSDEEKGLKKESVVVAINKACTEGVTCAGAFSMAGITKKLREMLSLIDSGEEFNRDRFFREFQQLYTLVMAPDKRAKGVFHPSQLLDGCPRLMTYDLLGVAPTDTRMSVVSGELQRTFDVGTWYHIYIQSILYQIGYLKQAEVPVVNKSKYLNGKADGVFNKEVFGEEVVLEIKTMNDWMYQRAVFKPFKKHEFQASLYARELGIKKVLYLYINKNTSEIKEFLMPINEEQLAVADKKMNTVIDHVKHKTLPPATCPDRFCDNALACPFVSLCFKKKEV